MYDPPHKHWCGAVTVSSVMATYTFVKRMLQLATLYSLFTHTHADHLTLIVDTTITKTTETNVRAVSRAVVNRDIVIGVYDTARGRADAFYVPHEPFACGAPRYRDRDRSYVRWDLLNKTLTAHEIASDLYGGLLGVFILHYECYYDMGGAFIYIELGRENVYEHAFTSHMGRVIQLNVRNRKNTTYKIPRSLSTLLSGDVCPRWATRLENVCKRPPGTLRIKHAICLIYSIRCVLTAYIFQLFRL